MHTEQMKQAVNDCMSSIAHSIQIDGSITLDELLETESIILALNCLYLTGGNDALKEFSHGLQKKGKQ